MDEKQRQSILISFLIGAPVGVFGVFCIIFFPSFFFKDGLLSMDILSLFGYAIIGLVVAFLIALWLGGVLVYRYISKGKSLLYTSFRYASFVNIVIWAIFYLIALFSLEQDHLKVLGATAMVCLAFIVFTTFTVGLWICYEIKRMLK